MRRCVDCGADISRRHREAFLCQSCAAERQFAREREVMQRRKTDPEYQARYRAYHRDWWHKKHPRIVRMRSCACGCGRTFDATSGGRPRVFHPDCAVFYRRMLKNESYRRWYRRNRERELAKDRAYKKLRRAA